MERSSLPLKTSHKPPSLTVRRQLSRTAAQDHILLTRFFLTEGPSPVSDDLKRDPIDIPNSTSNFWTRSLSRTVELYCVVFPYWTLNHRCVTLTIDNGYSHASFLIVSREPFRAGSEESISTCCAIWR